MWNGSMYTAFRNVSVAMLLYADGDGYEKRFDETVRMYETQASA